MIRNLTLQFRGLTSAHGKYSTVCVPAFPFKRLISSSTSLTRQLNIAYFGSDFFSVLSLQKLVDYQQENPDAIASINVITRGIKRTGRNLKQLVDTPIGLYASSNDIKVNRADSSNEILNLLTTNLFDLAIAVSYGKLIPEDFLSRMKFGGLNVHPSLLPKYSGSSPIQYSLMNNDTFTGVSVQTLHPTKFDKGDVILQSSQIEIKNNDNYTTLEKKLGEVGSDLLVETIDKELYVPPLKPIKSTHQYSLASKIQSSTREINWNENSSMKIKRLHDALGPIYSYITQKDKHGAGGLLKAIFTGVEVVDSCRNFDNLIIAGQFTLCDDKLMVKTIDGHISIEKIKLQYCSEETPSTFISKLPKRAGHTTDCFITTNSV